MPSAPQYADGMMMWIWQTIRLRQAIIADQ